jgi:branched-chain amino acid transport system substrate-binding protein
MKAAADKKAVYYIGEFNSAASEFSIPILNQAGLAQVSPGSGYIGLTSQVPSVRDATLHQQPNEAGEPARYYPAGPNSRNFVRLIPSDVVQAAAGAQALKRVLGCTRVALASDRTQHAMSLAALIQGSAPMFGLAAGTPTEIAPNRTDFRNYVENLRTHFNCLAYVGTVSTGAIDLVREIHLLAPSMPILGTDGVCSDSWTKPQIGGTPTAIDPLMYCTRPTLPFTKYPGGPSLLGLYHHLYGSHANPNPWAIYGYEAMELGIDTIAQLGRGGAGREAVRQGLFATTARLSVLGSYSITGLGETTLTTYGLYKASAEGGLYFSRVLNPSPRILTTT